MNSFDQFNIKATEKGFEGDKIRMSKILNRRITLHDFKIEDSKVEAFKKNGNEKCLYLQISFDNVKHIVFTSSSGLIEVIQQIPELGFPFTTTIIQEGERYLFT